MEFVQHEAMAFVPEKIADELDFIAMHIYPEKGKVDEALEIVKGFAAVGKPVVIEETFPLKCGQDEMEHFIDQSQSDASGWISFYWGKTPKECRRGGTIGEAIMANWLESFPKKMAQIESPFEDVKCDGTQRVQVRQETHDQERSHASGNPDGCIRQRPMVVRQLR